MHAMSARLELNAGAQIAESHRGSLRKLSNEE
jgi:hypothetical protein